jgi:hypothetical protein
MFCVLTNLVHQHMLLKDDNVNLFWSLHDSLMRNKVMCVPFRYAENYYDKLRSVNVILHFKNEQSVRMYIQVATMIPKKGIWQYSRKFDIFCMPLQKLWDKLRLGTLAFSQTMHQKRVFFNETGQIMILKPHDSRVSNCEEWLPQFDLMFYPLLRKHIRRDHWMHHGLYKARMYCCHCSHVHEVLRTLKRQLCLQCNVTMCDVFYNRAYCKTCKTKAR